MGHNDAVLKDFMRIATDAIHAEDLVLRNLVFGRPSLKGYVPSVFNLFETGLVYTVFKALLASPFSLRHHVHWEGSFAEGKKADLVLHPEGKGRWGIEAKWYVSGCRPIHADAAKLMAGDFERAFLFCLLDTWEGARRRFETIVEEVPRGVGWSLVLSPELRTGFDTQLREGPGRIELALLEVKRGS